MQPYSIQVPTDRTADVPFPLSSEALSAIHDVTFQLMAFKRGQPIAAAQLTKLVGELYANLSVVDHDIEQLEYVAARNATFKRWLSENGVLDRFRRVRKRIPPLEQLELLLGAPCKKLLLLAQYTMEESTIFLKLVA